MDQCPSTSRYSLFRKRSVSVDDMIDDMIDDIPSSTSRPHHPANTISYDDLDSGVYLTTGQSSIQSGGPSYNTWSAYIYMLRLYGSRPNLHLNCVDNSSLLHMVYTWLYLTLFSYSSSCKLQVTYNGIIMIDIVYK